MQAITRSLVVATLALGTALPARGQAEPGAVTMPPPGTAMVFVNTGAILPIAPGADQAQAKFQTELQVYENELAELSTELDSLLAVYRRQESLMDPSAREAKRQEILQKQQAAQARQLQLEQQSEVRRTELLQPILENVRSVIEDLRAEQSYSIVFDIAESGVIAADPALDITGAVLERLGVSRPAASAPPNP
jgi:outer membrane protein